jgi:hypothetical protein
VHGVHLPAIASMGRLLEMNLAAEWSMGLSGANQISTLNHSLVHALKTFIGALFIDALDKCLITKLHFNCHITKVHFV